jgi:hypothetical protein
MERQDANELAIATFTALTQECNKADIDPGSPAVGYIIATMMGMHYASNNPYIEETRGDYRALLVSSIQEVLDIVDDTRYE